MVISWETMESGIRSPRLALIIIRSFQLLQNIYNADGEKLSYISQGSVVWLDKDRKRMTSAWLLLFLVCQGYMKTEDLQALDASKDFILIMRVMDTVFITMWLRMLVSQ